MFHPRNPPPVPGFEPHGYQHVFERRGSGLDSTGAEFALAARQIVGRAGRRDGGSRAVVRPGRRKIYLTGVKKISDPFSISPFPFFVVFRFGLQTRRRVPSVTSAPRPRPQLPEDKRRFRSFLLRTFIFQPLLSPAPRNPFYSQTSCFSFSSSYKFLFLISSLFQSPPPSSPACPRPRPPSPTHVRTQSIPAFLRFFSLHIFLNYSFFVCLLFFLPDYNIYPFCPVSPRFFEASEF